jgi:hypothetical protein
MLASMDIFVNTSLRKLKIDPFGAPILMSLNAKIYSYTSASSSTQKEPSSDQI